MRGDRDQTLPTVPRHGDVRHAMLPQAIERRPGSHRGDAGTVARNLGGEELGVLARRQADHHETIGMRIDDSERALTDRAGGTEDRDAFHCGDKRSNTADTERVLNIFQHEVINRRGEQQCVDSIEDAAVAGNQS